MKAVFTTLFFFLFTSFFFITSAQVIYVDSSATMGADNGMSWADAYNDLQDALATAPVNGQIWVAKGTYTPDTMNGNPSTTFLIHSDVILLGGFSGSETDSSQRNPDEHLTILSGDLNGDDVDSNFVMNRSDNVMTVVTISSSITNESLIDGFTISNGHADGASGSQKDGAGIYCSGDPIIKQCHFTQNYAIENGGSIMLVSGSNPSIENCVLENSLANVGGAIFIGESQFLIKKCSIQHNSTFDGMWQINGGGIFIRNSNGVIQDCLFEGNSSEEFGGGLFVWNTSGNNGASLDLIDCMFKNNIALRSGGGASIGPWGNNTSYTVTGCDFIDNEAMQGGGLGFHSNGNSNNASLIVDNCVFENNNAINGGSALTTIFSGSNNEFELRNCQFIENTSELSCGAVDLWGDQEGTGNVLIDSCFFDGNVSYYNGGLNMNVGEASKIDFTLTNSIFTNNEATEGGAMGLWCDSNNQNEISLLLDKCVFDGNVGTIRAGAIAFNPESDKFDVTIRRSTIINNESPSMGAIGSYYFQPGTVYQGANIQIENSLIANNTSDDAVIVLDSTANFSMLNCTVANNLADGIHLTDSSSITLQNTILYNSGYTEYVANTNDVTVISSGGNLFGDNSLVDYALSSDFQEEDPLFEEMGNDCEYYQLKEDSPVIDKGINPDSTDYDLCGYDRIHNMVIDIGAIESPYSVSVKEIITGELELSPNPAAEYLNIHLPETINQLIKIGVFDIQGRLMSQQYFSNGETIEVGSLPPGMYLLKAIDDEKIYTGKFIKQ